MIRYETNEGGNRHRPYSAVAGSDSGYRGKQERNPSEGGNGHRPYSAVAGSDSLPTGYRGKRVTQPVASSSVYDLRSFWGCGCDDVVASSRLFGHPFDPDGSHMLVSETKPCKSKYKPLYGETANGSLNQL